MNPRRYPGLPRLALLLTLATAVLLAAACADSPSPWPTVPAATATAAPAPTATADPLVPTLPPQGVISPTLAAALPSPTATVTATLPPPSAAPLLEPSQMRSRLGVSVPRNVETFHFDAEMARQLGMGWYLDWSVDLEPVQADGLEFAQMVRVRGDKYYPERAELIDVIAANPGALWLIGNEPDVLWQDNTTAEQYAARYHELHTLIKTLDPSAQVAIGGVSQATPLRLQYLEEVLAAYEKLVGTPMPVDVWNVHAFVLREERDSWGVSIPPGFEVDQGMLWEIDDHDSMELFQQQIVDFRRWMERHGQRDKPLIVTEYGILMPPEYGFPPERVTAFMRSTFDYLLNARDDAIGYPADDNRLVQKLAWFSLSDEGYPTGNLLDPQTGELTEVGRAFADYAASLDADQ